ncbi:MAG: hypothetical protein AAFX65_07485 [Cyanobacteria bacterium J06638_7]
MNLDKAAAARMLSVLGIETTAAHLRAIHWDAPNMNGRGAIDLPPGDPRRQNLNGLQAQGYNLYLGAGGGREDADVTELRHVFAEWDDLEPSDVLGQLQELGAAGLPDPTLVLTTWDHGSVHVWWALSHTVPADRWRALMRKLVICLSSDRTCINPSRVMRLAGSVYWAKTGKPRAGEQLGIARVLDAESTEEFCSFNDLESWADAHLQAHPELQAIQQAETTCSTTPPSNAERAEQCGRALLPPRPLEQIEAALAVIPRRQSGLPNDHPWKYPAHRFVACGLRDALYRLYQQGSADDPDLDAATAAEAEAIRRMEAHSPSRECGWNVAQVLRSSAWLHEGNFWAAAGRSGFQLSTPRPERPPRQPRQPPEQPPHVRSQVGLPAPFRALGRSEDGEAHYMTSDGRLWSFTVAQHNSNHYQELADLNWWAANCPNRKGDPDWTLAYSLCSTLTRQAGWFEPDSVRGQGAWRDGNSIVVNLGDRLIINGTTHPQPQPDGLQHFYPSRPPAVGPGDATPLSDDEGLAILQLGQQFRWRCPAHGVLLCGWLVMAPFSGALQRWRSHLWLTAPRGSGKSALLEGFVEILLGDLAHKFSGDLTEAGLRQRIVPGALPVVCDETEGRSKGDQERIQSVLKLARSASSGKGSSKVTGSSGGAARLWNVRSMFLFSSIVTALDSEADRSRWAVVELLHPNSLSPAERISHWEALSAALRQHINDDTGQRLLARTIGLLPLFVGTIQTFSKAAAELLGEARHGDQYGLLLAGAWLLQTSAAPTDEQARQWISSFDWSAAVEIENMNEGGAETCWSYIEGLTLPVEELEPGDLQRFRTVRRTVAELLHRVVTTASEEAANALGRVGIRLHHDDEAGMVIAVATRNQPLTRLVSDTPWAGTGWISQLKRLQVAGVEQKRLRLRFPGLTAGRSGTDSRCPCYWLPPPDVPVAESAPPF